MSGLGRTGSDPARSGDGALRGPSALVGQVLGGDFEVRRKIGQGGMGTVYEAWQRSLKRPVALKVLANSLAMTDNVVTRFQREAEAAANLHHPNIVPIYARGDHDGLYFYAMELVDGRSLNEIIAELRGERRGSSLDLTETKLIVGGDRAQPENARETDSPSNPDDTAQMAALSGAEDPSSASRVALTKSTAAHYTRIAELMASAADAVAYAHRHGVIHRDIKPHNFMYGNDDRLYITDFGLARVLEQPGVTVTGEFVGSPLYMAPEQITGAQAAVDHRADIYSLGATLYEWLTLWPPFPGETREQVISKIISTDAPAPRSLNPKTPIDLETICLKALEKTPNRRYANAAAMAEDLRRFVRRESVRAKRDGWITRTARFCGRNRAAVLAVGVSIAVLSFASAYLSYQSQASEKALIAAAERERRDSADRIESLEAENQRLVDTLGGFPIESAVVGSTLEVMADVATGALAAIAGPSPAPAPPARPAPRDPAELLLLTRRDAQLIEYVAEALINKLRSTHAGPAVGELGSPGARMAEAYYGEALDASQPESALSLVNLAVNSAFDHFDALQLRCILYLRLSQLEKAIEDANLLVMFREESAAGYLMRGLAGLLRTRDENVEVDLNRAVMIDPAFAAVWVTRGAARARRGAYLKALSDFENALDLSPNHPTAMAERDQVFVLAGYSVRHLTDRLDEDPDDYDALVRRGELHYLLGDYPSAMSDYERASATAGETSAGLIYRKMQTQQKLNNRGNEPGVSAPRSSPAAPERGVRASHSDGLGTSLLLRLVRVWLR